MKHDGDWLIIIVGSWIVAMLIFIGIDATTPDAPPALPACVSEDSPGPCYWDADTRGNKQGTSFVVTKDGTVIYLPESETK